MVLSKTWLWHLKIFKMMFCITFLVSLIYACLVNIRILSVVFHQEEFSCNHAVSSKQGELCLPQVKAFFPHEMKLKLVIFQRENENKLTLPSIATSLKWHQVVKFINTTKIGKHEQPVELQESISYFTLYYILHYVLHCIPETLKYWVGVQQGQSYLLGEKVPL